jgi:hypothetical protein
MLILGSRRNLFVYEKRIDGTLLLVTTLVDIRFSFFFVCQQLLGYQRKVILLTRRVEITNNRIQI